MKKAFIIFLLSIAVIPMLAYPQNFTLDSLVEEGGAKLYWNPFSEKGLIIGEEQHVLLHLNAQTAIDSEGNYFEIDFYRNSDGNVEFSEETYQSLLTLIKPTMPLFQPRVTTIFIDPGHGGKDPGTIGKHEFNGETVSVVEKNIVLAIAQKLDRLLKARFPDKTIRLSRNSDVYPSLEERTSIANEIESSDSEAVIFLSIHANASFSSRAQGFEVWYLPTEYRRELLDPEQVDEDSKEILPILNTMLEEEYSLESILLAKNISEELNNEVGDVTDNRGLKEETWFVVKNAKMPSVLVEVGFVTNKEEARRLTDDEYLNSISTGIYNGIVRFIRHFESLKF